MHHRKEGATERIGVGHRGGRGVDGGLRRRGLLGGPKGSPLTLRIPRRQVVGRHEALEVLAHIRISHGIGDQHGVVDIPGGLLPGVKYHLVPSMIGVQRGDHPFNGVIEERGTDPDLLAETERVRVIEERLVLFDGLAFIVKDSPPAADPAWADCCPTLDYRARFSLDLLLNFATKAIGIAHAHLDLESAGWQGIARMRFTAEGGGEDGLLRPEIAFQVIHNPRAGLSQQWGGIAQRISEERLALLQGQIGRESRQGVALHLGCFAHDRGAYNQPQGIEGHLGAVAVGVGDAKRLQEAVLMVRSRPIAERIGRLCGEQVVWVIAHEGRVAEGVAGTVWEKEVLARKGEFLGRGIGHLWGVEDPLRGNPPRGVAFTMDIAAVRGQYRIGDTVAVDLGEQPRGEGELEVSPGSARDSSTPRGRSALRSLAR